MSSLLAPFISQYVETASWITGATSKTSPQISWNVGDLIVVAAVNENNNQALSGPTNTATGLSIWTVQKIVSAASNTVCHAFIATAVATGSDTGTISVSEVTGTNHFGFSVWVLRGAGAVGVSVEQHTATRTVALTATQPNSLIIWCMGDFAAGAIQSVLPTPNHARVAVQNTGYTVYINDTNQPSIASVSYGIGGSGTGPFSIIVLEVMAAPPVWYNAGGRNVIKQRVIQ